MEVANGLVVCAMSMRGVVVALSLWAPLFARAYAILLPAMHV